MHIKLLKQKLSSKVLDELKVEDASGSTRKATFKVVDYIESKEAKKIVKEIKEKNPPHSQKTNGVNHSNGILTKTKEDAVKKEHESKEKKTHKKEHEKKSENKEIGKLKKKIEELIKQNKKILEDIKKAKLDKITQSYAKMRPKNAASILSNMKPKDALSILQKLQPKI